MPLALMVSQIILIQKKEVKMNEVTIVKTENVKNFGPEIKS